MKLQLFSHQFPRIKLYLLSSFEIISLKRSFSLDFLAIFSLKRNYDASALLPSVRSLALCLLNMHTLLLQMERKHCCE
uniref:Uncharacterized protein n=1 Tax=Gossypium raimondii TaxID=29730 RepID=A0A0D2QZ75_GOSRA|nr:hypothetical protein B456_004G171100 [Gossypium raimondii]